MVKYIIGPTVLGALMAAADWTSNLDPLLKLVESVGVLGVLVWYLWYITSKDRPRIEQRHQEMLERTEKSHADALHDLVGDFRKEFQEQRQASTENVRHIVAQMEQSNATVLEVVRNCAAVRAIRDNKNGN